MDLQLRLAFAAAMVATVAAMKITNLRLRGARFDARFFATPLPSLATWEACPAWTASHARDAATRAALFALPLAATWVAALFTPTPARPWVAALAVLWLGEALGPLAQLACAPLGRRLPSHHDRPLAAPDLSDFWGRRWNTWASDWFREVLFRPLRRRPGLGALVVFVYSGLWHEAIINLPLYLVTGVSVFGTMMAFFLVQWLCVIVDRRLPAPLRRPFLFAAVLGPAPLFVNAATLRILGLSG